MDYLLKSASVTEVIETIHRALRGKRAKGPGPLPDPLTPREVDVLRLAAEGLTNTQIAGRLPKSDRPTADPITERTIKRYFSYGIFPKLEVDNRVDAIRRARELGYLPPEPCPANGRSR
jgi:two-component system response regulator DesR